MKALILNSIKEIGLSSSSHGIPNIIRSKRIFIRIVWTVCFLTSSGLCIFQLTSSVFDFLNYDVITNFKIVDEVPALFPTVSICNINPFYNQQGFDFVRKFLNENQIVEPQNTFLNQSISSSKTNFYLAKFMVGNTALNSNLSDEFRKSMGQDWDDLFISCTFHSKDCKIEDFEWFYDFRYGNCYKFNSFGNLSVSRPGILNGLQLELFVGQPTGIYSLASQSGAVIFIHNTTINPFVKEIGLSVGTDTHLVVSKDFTYKLGKPFSECINDLTKLDSYDSELYRIVFNSTGSYHRTDCHNLCIQKYVLNNCKCQIAEAIKYSKSVEFCSKINDFRCSLGTFLNVSSNLRYYCRDDCPLECDSINYPISLSYRDYPTEFYSEILKNKTKSTLNRNFSSMNYQTLRRNILGVSVFYEELKYLEIREIAKTSMGDLISNLGGTLGLFIGVSFLSFIEIVEIVLEILFIYIDDFKSRKRLTKVSNF